MTTLDVGGDQWQREDLDSGLGPSGGQFNSNSFDLISKEVFFLQLKKFQFTWWIELGGSQKLNGLNWFSDAWRVRIHSISLIDDEIWTYSN